MHTHTYCTHTQWRQMNETYAASTNWWIAAEPTWRQETGKHGVTSCCQQFTLSPNCYKHYPSFSLPPSLSFSLPTAFYSVCVLYLSTLLMSPTSNLFSLLFFSFYSSLALLYRNDKRISFLSVILGSLIDLWPRCCNCLSAPTQLSSLWWAGLFSAPSAQLHLILHTLPNNEHISVLFPHWNRSIHITTYL